MVQKLWNRLNAPFPEPEGWGETFKNALSAGVIVAVVVYGIQPGGVPSHTPQQDVIFGALIFGAVTTTVALLFELVFHYILGVRRDVPSWTLLRWIVSVAALICLVAVANFLVLNWMQNWRVLTWGALSEMLVSTFLVGLVPIIYFGLTTQRKESVRNMEEARHIQNQIQAEIEEPTRISLHAQNGEVLDIELEQLCFIEAQQNYVAVYYEESGELQRKLLRNTLSSIEHQLNSTTILRCHRSFLVHLTRIENVTGNAQGLRLSLRGVADQYVPVSRKYIPILRAAL